MREVILDSETTGLNSDKDDRIVEIGCVELVNHIATGNNYHQYINPERSMPDEAFKVHGLSEDFLSDFPVMADVVGDFSDFIGPLCPFTRWFLIWRGSRFWDAFISTFFSPFCYNFLQTADGSI